MYKLLTKNGQLFALVLGVVSAAIALFSIVSGIKGAGYSMSDDLNQIMKNNPEATFDFFNPAVYIVAALVGLALVAWLIFGAVGLFSNPKGSIKFIIAFVVIAIVVFILYNMAVNESSGKIYELIQTRGISDHISKMISAGIKTTVGLIFLSVFAIISMEVVNAFK